MNNTVISTTPCVTIKLYPNHTSDYFQISGIEGTAMVFISDLNYLVLLKKQITEDENISVNTLRKGVYIAKIITINGTFERKLVKL